MCETWGVPHLCGYSLVTRDDASVASHTNEGPFAIGGTLTDSSPYQSGTVAGTSHVQDLNGNHRFHFQGGVIIGHGIPFNFSQFEQLAQRLESSENGWYRIHVFCRGGTIRMDDLNPGQLRYLTYALHPVLP